MAAQDALAKKAELQKKKMEHIKSKNALLQKLIEQSKKPDLPKEKKYVTDNSNRTKYIEEEEAVVFFF